MNVVAKCVPALGALIFLVGGCGGGDSDRSIVTPSPTASVKAEKASDLNSLISLLQDQGVSVRVEQQDTGFPFVVTGTALAVNSQVLEVFEYPYLASAEADAARISPDGTKITEKSADNGTVASDFFWPAPPHFYRNGTLIVLYVGGDVGIMEALEAVMNPQFAGG